MCIAERPIFIGRKLLQMHEQEGKEEYLYLLFFFFDSGWIVNFSGISKYNGGRARRKAYLINWRIYVL